jgi:hypothetical protein
MTFFAIEDESHAEWCGSFESFDEALHELKTRATLPWDEDPNLCPCASWETCGRKYEIVELDDSSDPMREVSRVLVLEISARGVVWHNTP